jgi:hypothetical protein
MINVVGGKNGAYEMKNTVTPLCIFKYVKNIFFSLWKDMIHWVSFVKQYCKIKIVPDDKLVFDCVAGKLQPYVL